MSLEVSLGVFKKNYRNVFKVSDSQSPCHIFWLQCPDLDSRHACRSMWALPVSPKRGTAWLPKCKKTSHTKWIGKWMQWQSNHLQHREEGQSQMGDLQESHHNEQSLKNIDEIAPNNPERHTQHKSCGILKTCCGEGYLWALHSFSFGLTCFATLWILGLSSSRKAQKKRVLDWHRGWMHRARARTKGEHQPHPE